MKSVINTEGAAKNRSGVLHKSWSRALLVVLLFIVISGYLLYPRTVNMEGMLHVGPDPKVLIWSMSWVHHAVLSEPWNFFRAPIFYPHLDSYAYSDSLLMPSLLVLPFKLFTGEFTVLYNLATWITYVLSGLFMYFLVRYLTGSYAISIIAGILFAFSPFRLDNITHLQYANQQWLPLTILAILLWFFERKKRWLLATVAFSWATAMSCATYLVMSVIPFGLFVMLLWIAKPMDLRDLGVMLLAGLLLIVALAPFYIPLFKVTQEIGLGPNLEEVVRFSPDLFDFAKQPKYLVSAPYSILPEKIKTPYFSFFPGFISAAVILAAFALFFRNGHPGTSGIVHRAPPYLLKGLKASGWITIAIFAVSTFVVISHAASIDVIHTDISLLSVLFWLLLFGFNIRAILSAIAFSFGTISRDAFLLRSFLAITITSALLALGPYIHVLGRAAGQNIYWLFYSIFPGFKTLRQVLQFNTFTMLFAIPAAALALKRLRRMGQGSYLALMAGIFLLIGAEYQTDLSRDYEPVPLEVPEFYQWLAQEPVESPFIMLPAASYPHHPESNRQYWAMYHQRPMVNGQFSYWPVEYQQMVERTADFPSERSVRFIQNNYKLRFIVVRPNFYRPEQLQLMEENFAAEWCEYKLLKKWKMTIDGKEKDVFWVFENQKWDPSLFYTVAPPPKPAN